MQAPPELQAFGELQRKLGQAVMDTVLASVNDPWKEVSLDLRLRSEQSSHLMEFQATLVSGSVVPVRPSAGIMMTLREIVQMRGAFSQEPWFGIRLAITENGQCKVTFNYDPNCADDPAFLKG